MTGYRTIVADPPWEMDTRRIGGSNWAKGQRARTGFAYPTMPTEDIKALPVADLAADDAHLYLWTVQRHLRASFEVAEAWGFRPAATLVWCKQRGGFIGGAFFSNVEFVLYCRRGKLAHNTRVNSQWFDWPRGEHSAKPEAFLDLVEQVSLGPYLEMFARRDRLGWDTWGNESLGTAEMVA